jgi:hypothetical protein
MRHCVLIINYAANALYPISRALPIAHTRFFYYHCWLAILVFSFIVFSIQCIKVLANLGSHNFWVDITLHCTRRSVAVHTIVSVVLAWLTFVTFNLAVLIFPISIGRALLFAITQLPLAGGLKYNGNDCSEIVIWIGGLPLKQSKHLNLGLAYLLIFSLRSACFGSWIWHHINYYSRL